MRNILFISFFSLAFLIACDDADTYDVREDALINYKTDINGEWNLYSIARGSTDLSAVHGTGLRLTIADGTLKHQFTKPWAVWRSKINYWE